MTDPQYTGVLRAIMIGAAFAILTLLAWLLVVPTKWPVTYRFDVTVVVQGPSSDVARSESLRVIPKIERLLSLGAETTPEDASDTPSLKPNGDLTGTWLRITHLVVTSRSLLHLNQIKARFAHSSRWQVVDTDRTGQFLLVDIGHNLKRWRLRKALGTSDKSRHVRVMTSGPSTAFDPSEPVTLLLLLFLALSFGAAERRNEDPHAFPRGMHPFVVASQIVFIGLFACAVLAYTAAGQGGFNAGFILVSCAVIFALGRWLFISRGHWDRPVLILSWRVIAASVMVIGVAAILTGLGDL